MGHATSYIDTKLVSICAYLSSAATSIYYCMDTTGILIHIYTYIIYIYYHILNMITVLRGRTTQLLTKFVITWLVRNQIWQPVEKFPNYAPGGRTSLRFLHKKSPSEHHIPICSMYAISTNIYVIQKMTRNLLVNIQETWSTSDFLDVFSYNCSEAQEDRTVKFDQTIVANDFSIFFGGLWPMMARFFPHALIPRSPAPSIGTQGTVPAVALAQAQTPGTNRHETRGANGGFLK